MHAIAEADEGAVFNIGTAARKSGLTVTTIRTWEDRYGAVVPVRDGSGRRLYSNEQIAQLTWLRQQIDAGLRASEAHRLLLSGDVDESAHSAVIDRGSAWATYLSWLEQQSEWVGSILGDLQRGLSAAATAAAAVIPNPISGHVITVVGRRPESQGEGDDQMAAMAALSASSVPGLAEALDNRESFFDDGASFGVSFDKVAVVPIAHGGVLAGTLIAAGSFGADAIKLVERAARVIESRIEADRARSAFSNLLD